METVYYPVESGWLHQSAVLLVTLDDDSDSMYSADTSGAVTDRRHPDVCILLYVYSRSEYKLWIFWFVEMKNIVKDWPDCFREQQCSLTAAGMQIPLADVKTDVKN